MRFYIIFGLDSALGFSVFCKMGLLHLFEDDDFGFLDSKFLDYRNLDCTLAFCETCV